MLNRFQDTAKNLAKESSFTYLFIFIIIHKSSIFFGRVICSNIHSPWIDTNLQHRHYRNSTQMKSVGNCCCRVIILHFAIKSFFRINFVALYQRICLNHRLDWLAKISLYLATVLFIIYCLRFMCKLAPWLTKWLKYRYFLISIIFHRFTLY